MAARAAGFSRQHAVVGVSETCIATYPSDTVAMRLLDAVVETITRRKDSQYHTGWLPPAGENAAR